MTRSLPKTDSDAREYVQFRGPQTSVTHDPTGVRFETEHRRGRIAHQPLPVVDDDADPADVPDDAVARSVAQALVESNPLVCWGVACEAQTSDGVCGEVFDTPKSLNSHQSVHTTDPDHGADGSAPAADGDDGDDGGDDDDVEADGDDA